jgi:hypothetical protein
MKEGLYSYASLRNDDGIDEKKRDNFLVAIVKFCNLLYVTDVSDMWNSLMLLTCEPQ